MLRKITIVALLLSSVFVALLFLSPVDSRAWRPPLAPMLDGDYAANNKLKQAELIALGDVYGPEDIAIDTSGVIYGGTQDGRIIKVLLDGSVETFVETGGRPLGLHFDAQGNLIVCDAYKGLLSINSDGLISVLVDEVGGVPLAFTNDVDIASDGRIYFTDASSKWNQASYMKDLYETQPYGRFMVYDPATQKTSVLIDKLFFANGVAISSKEDFVLVNETWRYRILKFWLKGDKAGSHELFADNLPGFPDGISSDRNGTFWLALPTPRNPIIDRLHPFAFLKQFFAALPEWMAPGPVEYGFVLGFDERGNVIHNLQEPHGEWLNEITSVQESGGYLYLGTLGNDRIGRYKLSQ